MTCLACSVRSISKWADGLFIVHHKSPMHYPSVYRACGLPVTEILNAMPKSLDYDDQVLHESGRDISIFKEPVGLKPLALLFPGIEVL